MAQSTNNQQIRKQHRYSPDTPSVLTRHSLGTHQTLSGLGVALVTASAAVALDTCAQVQARQGPRVADVAVLARQTLRHIYVLLDAVRGGGTYGRNVSNAVRDVELSRSGIEITIRRIVIF